MSLLMDKLKEKGIVEKENGQIVNKINTSISRKQIQQEVLPTARKSFLKNPTTAKVQNNRLNTSKLIGSVLPTAIDLGIRAKYGDATASLVKDTKNVLGNLALGGYNGVLHFVKQVNDLNLRTHESEQKLFNETAKKFGLEESPSNNIQQRVIEGLNNSQNNISNIIKHNANAMQENIDNSTNNVSKKLSQLSGSIGQMLPGFIPGIGPVYFAGSASSQYIDEAIQRGMNKDEARTYGGIMGLVESGTESLGAFLTKGVGKALIKGNVLKALKTYGLDITENALEEAVIEPISEGVATLTGGKETADTTNLWNRMLQSGIDGGLTSLITGGVSYGIGSAINLSKKIQNKEKITQEELKNTIRDIKNNTDIDIEGTIKNNIENSIKENTKLYNNTMPTVNGDKISVVKSASDKLSNTLPTAKGIAPSELMRGINKRTKNNLILNADSLPTAKAKLEGNKITIDYENGRLEDIIHEATHYSEANSKGYEVLSNHVLTELERTQELQAIKEDITSRYQEVYEKEGRTFTEDDLNKEVVAKYTERFIADESFVNKMANADKTLSQRILGWIKDKINYYKTIAKMEPEQITEYDNLRKAEKLWEIALKGVKGQNNNTGIKYSTIYNEDGTFNRVKIEDNIFENNKGKSIQKTIKDYLIKHIGEYADIIESGQRVYLGEDLPGEYTYSKATENLPVASKLAKGRAATELKEIINNAKNRTWEKNKKIKHEIDARYGFYRYDTVFSFEHNGREQIYQGKILIRNDENGKKYLYDILDIKKIGNNLPLVASNSKKSSAIISGSNSLPTNSISQKDNTVNNSNMQKPEKNTQKVENTALKANDTVMPRYSIAGKKGGINYEENFEKNQENLSKNRHGNKTLVDGRERLENNTIEAERANNKQVTAMKATDEDAPSLKQRRFYKNVKTSWAVEKELKALIKPKDYRKISNEESMNEAIVKLAQDKDEATKWLGRVSRDKYQPSNVDVAEGLVLLAKYQHEKKYEQANDVIDRLAEIGTKGGQAIQMYSLLQRLTPEGMVVYATRRLKEAFDMDSQNKNQKWIDEHKDEYKLTADDQDFIKERMDKVATMENGRDKEILLAEIQKRMMEKLPPEKGSGIKAYMRISMLFNPKTQIRNILGNAVIAPVNMVGDTFGSFADKLVAKKTGIRTKGMTNVQSVIKGTSTGIYKSFDDFKRGINTRNLAGDRFELGKNERPSFSNKNRFGRAMNSLDRILSFMLDLGDRPFYESAFLNSINNQMELNNVPKPTAEMIEIATKEALQRTWQDNNGYTKAVLKIRDILNTNMRYGVGDWLIPFAKTPANLTKAIVDYSPPGLAKTLIKDAKELDNAISRNDKDIASYQHKFADNLGKGMAGSFLYLMGYALAKSGAITGDNDEDKDVANFMRNTLGVQPYSIKIGNKSFTYDWAQPVAAPLGIMANITNKDNKEASFIDKAWNSFTTATSMLVSQSFMQNINELFNSYGDWQENLLNVALELPARAMPTFLKQIADMVDGTQRTTFDKTSKTKTAINKVVTKIPFASKNLAPAVDTFGREIKKYGEDNNFFNVFLNPANTNKGQYTESAKEVYDLYKKTGDKTVFPRQAPYSVTNGDETIQMDSKTRTEYQKTAGKYADNSINQLIKSSDYKKLTNEEKIKILNSVFDDGTEIAKEINLGIERKLTDANKALTKGLSLSNMYIYENIINQIESDKDSEGETIRGSKNANMAEYITSMKTYETDKDIMLGLISDSRIKPTMKDLKVIGIENYAQYFSTNADKREEYVTLVKTGMNTSTLNKYLTEIGNIEGEKDKNGKTISGSKKSAIVNYINSLNGLTYNEKLILYAKQGYSMTTSERSKIFNYINSLKLTSDEKINLLKSMGSNYTINNDGKVYWD